MTLIQKDFRADVAAPLDHDDFGLKQSKTINVIDS